MKFHPLCGWIYIFPSSETASFEPRDYRVVFVYTKNRRIANRGNLVKISKELGGVKSYVLPDGVSGRFSELCPVELLPAAVLGIDIEERKKELDNAASNPDYIV